MWIVNPVVYDVLRCLEEKTMSFRELAAAAKGHSYTTLQKYLRELEELGFIEVKKHGRFPFKTEISLTPKGHELIGLLKHIKNLTGDG